MWVKICGLRSSGEVEACVKAGVDGLGFLVGQVHPSNDFISVEEAKGLVSQVPHSVMAIAVTHLERVVDIVEIVKKTGAQGLQVHSEVRPEDMAKLRKELPRTRLLKSYHVRSIESLVYGESYVGNVDAFVLDTLDEKNGRVGGTGKTHDWNLSADIVKRYRLPFVLAGGLTPENVSDAIAQVRPYGVDVNTGVKGSDGFKDQKKVERFVQAAKRV